MQIPFPYARLKTLYLGLGESPLPCRLGTTATTTFPRAQPLRSAPPRWLTHKSPPSFPAGKGTTTRGHNTRIAIAIAQIHSVPAAARRTETMLVPLFHTSSFSHFLGVAPLAGSCLALAPFDSRSLRCSFYLTRVEGVLPRVFTSLAYLLAFQLSRGSEENAAGRRCTCRLAGARSRALATPSVLQKL